MKTKLLFLFVAIVATTPLGASKIVTYTATEKLPETTNESSYGLHTNAFNASIVSHTFSNGTGIIKFSKEVTIIGYKAFCGCHNLISVTIPNSVKTIGSQAFLNINNIEYNGIASGSPWGAKCVNGYIDGYLVYSDASKTTLCGCSSIATGEIVIPNSVTMIGKDAFYNCKGLTMVALLNPNLTIGKEAFKGCTITDLYCGINVDLSNALGTIKNVYRLSEEELQCVLPFDQYVKEFVEFQINEWQKKGEFEKTSDWQKRVTETSKKHKMDSLIRIAKKNYLTFYQNANLTFTIGTYDADNEVYFVQSSRGEDLFVAIPIKEAPYVKQNWSSCIVTPYYGFEGTNVVLQSVDFTFPNKKTYSYQSSSTNATEKR